MICSFDPGETTGWVVWTDKGVPVDWGQAKGQEALEAVLEKLYYFAEAAIKTVVIEEFKLFKHRAKQQSGSSMETSQVEGLIKSWARRCRAEIVLQPASHLPIAQKWSGLKMPSNHAESHWVSAYNHGYYYFVQQSILKPKVKP